MNLKAVRKEKESSERSNEANADSHPSEGVPWDPPPRSPVGASWPCCEYGGRVVWWKPVDNL